MGFLLFVLSASGWVSVPGGKSKESLKLHMRLDPSRSPRERQPPEPPEPSALLPPPASLAQAGLHWAETAGRAGRGHSEGGFPRTPPGPAAPDPASSPGQAAPRCRLPLPPPSPHILSSRHRAAPASLRGRVDRGLVVRPPVPPAAGRGGARAGLGAGPWAGRGPCWPMAKSVTLCPLPCPFRAARSAGGGTGLHGCTGSLGSSEPQCHLQTEAGNSKTGVTVNWGPRPQDDRVDGRKREARTVAALSGHSPQPGGWCGPGGSVAEV